MVDVALMATMAVLCTILHIASTTSGRLQAKLFLSLHAHAGNLLKNGIGFGEGRSTHFLQLGRHIQEDSVLSGMNPLTNSREASLHIFLHVVAFSTELSGLVQLLYSMHALSKDKTPATLCKTANAMEERHLFCRRCLQIYI